MYCKLPKTKAATLECFRLATQDTERILPQPTMWQPQTPLASLSSPALPSWTGSCLQIPTSTVEKFQREAYDGPQRLPAGPPAWIEPTMPWKVRWGAHQAPGSLRPECAKQTGPISVLPTANGQTRVDRWVLYCVLWFSKTPGGSAFPS